MTALTSSRRRRRRATPFRGGAGTVVAGVVLWAFAAFCLFAFVFIVVSSLKTSRTIVETPWTLPDALHVENWAVAWEQGGLGRGFVNSVILVVGSAVVTVALSAPAAYALSRNVGRLSNAVVVYFVIGLGIPMQVVVLPIYAVLLKLGLIDNLFGLFLMYVVVNLPFTVFLLTGFFGTLPTELEDAAALDGLGPNQTFWRVMLPLAGGGLWTAVLLAAIGVWNETFLSLMFLNSNQNFTLPLAILNYYYQQQFSGSDYGALFAAASISLLPMVGLYVWFGRRLTEGLTVGAVK
jgi:multiple sugar transport system permease protein